MTKCWCEGVIVPISGEDERLLKMHGLKGHVKCDTCGSSGALAKDLVSYTNLPKISTLIFVDFKARFVVNRKTYSRKKIKA